MAETFPRNQYPNVYNDYMYQPISSMPVLALLHCGFAENFCFAETCVCLYIHLYWSLNIYYPIMTLSIIATKLVYSKK